MTQLQNENLTEYQTSQFYIREDKTHLTAELSTLQLPFAPQILWVRNSIGQRRFFTLCGADQDADGDIVGFHYRSEVRGKNTITMLLIND